MKIERLLAIVLLLFNRKKMTAPQLAEHFGVTVRTIYRDIDTIDAAGIPIVSNQGKGGGFAILDSYKLERQLFSPDDILSMLATLQGVENALGDSQLAASGSKLRSLVPRAHWEQFDQEFKIEVSPYGDTGENKKNLSILRNAIRIRKVVFFVYYNTAGETTERKVEPMTLIYKGSSWYLFAYCLLKKEYRLFRLSRIENCALEATLFDRRDGTYEDLFNHSMDTAVDHMVTLQLRFDPKVRYAVEDYFPRRFVKVQDDGFLRVIAELPDGEWLYNMLLYYGDAVEVLAPAGVRKRMYQKAVVLMKKHQDAD